MLPALPVDDLLDSLVTNYAVAYDRELFSLHSLDQRYTYGQLPEGDSDYSKSALPQALPGSSTRYRSSRRHDRPSRIESHSSRRSATWFKGG
jgi:hypothetical protein